jgi:hypothetical protein
MIQLFETFSALGLARLAKILQKGTQFVRMFKII